MIDLKEALVANLQVRRKALHQEVHHTPAELNSDDRPAKRTLGENLPGRRNSHRVSADNKGFGRGKTDDKPFRKSENSSYNNKPSYKTERSTEDKPLRSKKNLLMLIKAPSGLTAIFPTLAFVRAARRMN